LSTTVVVSYDHQVIVVVISVSVDVVNVTSVVNAVFLDQVRCRFLERQFKCDQ